MTEAQGSDEPEVDGSPADRVAAKDAAPRSKPPKSTPVIPAPPPVPRGGRKKSSSGGRGSAWFIATIVGVAAGVLVYGFVTDLRPYVDYWVALALS
jgi:hypothetical protein